MRRMRQYVSNSTSVTKSEKNDERYLQLAATNSYAHNAISQISTAQETSASLREISHDTDCNMMSKGTFSYSYDNIGNITRYLDANGNTVAQYTYDAFGKTISQSGTMSEVLHHRFSTKYFDSETGLYYYGYRFYSPTLMRWLNRDPIEEEGGRNLYACCANNLALRFDMLGLTAVSISMGAEFKDGRLGNSEFMRISITVLEKPAPGCHLNFIQLKKPFGGVWSVDSGRLGPYYYSLEELKGFSSFDDEGHAVVSLYDSPGGALSEDVMFYVAVVEVSRSCSSGKRGLIKCFDKVKLIDSRIWTYHPLGSKKYSYENISRGKGMIPTLKQLVNSASWSTELCSNTNVEIKE